ncbi:MAG: sigma-54-dependent Fis family transcriptional regulator [Deltaproteobacteria bacterium]|nr:sigma-54-dependent Fis family transcriptional regulator [Deltaproteobacteria bacterium]
MISLSFCSVFLNPKFVTLHCNATFVSAQSKFFQPPLFTVKVLLPLSCRVFDFWGEEFRMNKSDNTETSLQFNIPSTSETQNEPANNGWTKPALDQASEQAQSHLQTQEKNISGWLAEATPFIGQSAAIKEIFALIEKVANTDSTVLILGESGTGKELVARALHNNSIRRSRPFVPVNCGAIPSELLETELFGHLKGAYTGAIANRVGRFTLAHQGTLFLDEIGTMPASLQVKILRALQLKEFEPVGGNKTLKSDCRVIAATNIDLEVEVSKGTFREDLYYRLNVIPITLPSLRERREDIPLLINHFIKHFNTKKGYKIEGVSAEAMDVLCRYNWPGNVRELENICQRLCILKSAGTIEVSDLPAKLHQVRALSSSTTTPWSHWLTEGIPDAGIPFDDLVTQFENDLINKALEQTRWNKNKAAQLLHLNRTTLVEKIKKRGLAPSHN